MAQNVLNVFLYLLKYICILYIYIYVYIYIYIIYSTHIYIYISISFWSTFVFCYIKICCLSFVSNSWQILQNFSGIEKVVNKSLC